MKTGMKRNVARILTLVMALCLLVSLAVPAAAIEAAKGLDEETVRNELQAFLDQYNKSQPTYRQITGLVVRKNPFIRSSTKKIKRQEAMIDEPLSTT